MGSRRAPGDAGDGSQTSVTRVLPLAPFWLPTHVRTYRFACTLAEIDASAVCTGLATSLVGLATRFRSSAVAAQKPRRARTSTPRRLTRTLIGWNLPSVGAFEL